MLGFLKPSSINLHRSSLFHSESNVPPIPLESSLIISSFSSFFRRSTKPPFPHLLDQIYSTFSSPTNPNIKSLNPPFFSLSESLVLRVLRHNPSNPSTTSSLLRTRIRFFEWCAAQPNYFHSRSAHHSLFLLLRRHRRVSFVADCLRRLSPPAPIPAANRTLVIAHAVAGSPERALQLFARMRYNGTDLDYFCYHVLLNSLVEESLFELADSVFDQIEARGLAGPVTGCIRVKKLCREGRLDDAAEYLWGLYGRDERFVADRTVGTLVRALCRAGRVELAGRFVDEFSNVEVNGAWISHLVLAGRDDAALEFLRRRRGEDAERRLLYTFQYNRVILRLLGRNLLEEVCDLLVEMMEEGIEPDQGTMDAALCFFCKAGMVDVAIELYDLKMEIGVAPKRIVYDHLINALCRDGNVDEVLRVLEDFMNQGFFPGNQTFSRLANVLLRQGKLEKLRDLLAEASKRKLRSAAPIHSRYVSALCKIGAVKEAYSELLSADGVGAGVVMYKSTCCNLIRAFIKLRMMQFPPGLLIQMQELGFMPGRRLYREVVCSLCEMEMFDVVIDLLNKQLEIKQKDPRTCYNYIIDGAAHSKKPEMAMEVYTRMVNAGIEPNLCTDILILRCYMKSSRFGDAFCFFRVLKKKHLLSRKLYNVFIHGLCEAGRSEHAVEIWREMREQKLLPSLQCYEELVRALCSSNCYDVAIRVIKDFKDTGYQVSSFIFNVLMLHVLKGQKFLKAWDRSNMAGETNSRAVNQQIKFSVDMILGHLIKEFSNGLRMKENLEKFDDVIEQHFPVDIYTYNVLLRGSFLSGRVDFACNLFRRIQDKGYEPNRWTYDIMVHGFCKLGYRKLAEKWMEEMCRNGYQPTWYTMSLFINTS